MCPGSDVLPAAQVSSRRAWRSTSQRTSSTAAARLSTATGCRTPSPSDCLRCYFRSFFTNITAPVSRTGSPKPPKRRPTGLDEAVHHPLPGTGSAQWERHPGTTGHPPAAIRPDNKGWGRGAAAPSDRFHGRPRKRC